MNAKMKKFIKCTYTVLVMFILINMIVVSPTFAFGNTIVKTRVGATILKTLIAVSEVAVSGYFIIRFTITGIQYFTVVAATDKAEMRNRMKWTLLYGVLAFLAMYLFSYAVGL
ncbi:MAG: hypothetical protein IJ629_04160 [Clostridia bacterium]|nr:hypothetical protein [Clostridia bacterium]